jgi:hypothetical protein
MEISFLIERGGKPRAIPITFGAELGDGECEIVGLTDTTWD